MYEQMFDIPTMRSLDSDKKNAGTAGAATDSAATGTAATPAAAPTTHHGRRGQTEQAALVAVVDQTAIARYRRLGEDDATIHRYNLHGVRRIFSRHVASPP